MATDDEFTTRLIEFGLNEKEAQTYLYLLKYGPKTPSPLAKSLRTYREDVHRTLTSLIDKGMVRPSLDSPTIYTAVDLDTALESALKKRESELHEMEARKRELQELSKQQPFPPAEEVATFRIIKNSKELYAVTMSGVGSIKEEVVFVFPARTLSMFVGMTEVWKELVARGVRIRGIADISCKDAPCTGIEPVEPVQEFIDIGAEIRYLDHYHGLAFVVSDKKTCFNIINGDVRHVSRGNPLTVLWADDRQYAGYLTSTFELLWTLSIPAAQKIKELLTERSRSLVEEL
jgi:sugar-specific transcriptional regulator TrmB